MSELIPRHKFVHHHAIPLDNNTFYRQAAEYLPENDEYDIDDVDTIVKHLIKTYESLTQSKDVKSVLALKNIRLRHPLFSKMSLKAFQFLMDNSYMYKLKTGQFIYREGVQAAQHLYIIMYGQF